MVAVEDGVLDEAAFVDEGEEGFLAREVVVLSVLFVGARLAGRVCFQGRSGERRAEGEEMCKEERCAGR